MRGVPKNSLDAKTHDTRFLAVGSQSPVKGEGSSGERRQMDGSETLRGDIGGRGVSRRRLLNWIINTTVAAFVESILYPITRYLVLPKGEESSARAVTLLVKPAEVNANSGQIFKFGNQPGILVRTPAGELRAFSAICTHLACIVQYRSDFGHIWCACHNGHYHLQGKNFAGPPPRPLEQYPVNVRREQAVVSKAA